MFCTWNSYSPKSVFCDTTGVITFNSSAQSSKHEDNLIKSIMHYLSSRKASQTTRSGSREFGDVSKQAAVSNILTNDRDKVSASSTLDDTDNSIGGEKSS
jgi:hypothetical protein